MMTLQEYFSLIGVDLKSVPFKKLEPRKKDAALDFIKKIAFFPKYKIDRKSIRYFETCHRVYRGYQHYTHYEFEYFGKTYRLLAFPKNLFTGSTQYALLEKKGVLDI